MTTITQTSKATKPPAQKANGTALKVTLRQPIATPHKEAMQQALLKNRSFIAYLVAQAQRRLAD